MSERVWVVAYRLPATVVRFSGDVSRTTDELAPADERVVRSGSAALDVRADSRRVPLTLTLNEPQLEQLKTSLKLLPDGRLIGADTSHDPKEGDRLTAILSAASFAGGMAVPLAIAAGPVGLAAAAGIALTAGVAAGLATEPHFAELMRPALAERHIEVFGVDQIRQRGYPTVVDAPPPNVPSPEDLGIHPAFRHDHPAEHAALYLYRLGLLRSVFEHAHAAATAVQDPERAAATLRSLDRVLSSTRREAARVEETYSLWRQSKRTTTTKHFDWQLFVDELPTEVEFKEELSKPPAVQDAPWLKIACTIGLMVTCDLEEPNEPAPPAPGAGDPKIIYRQPLPARVTTWHSEIERPERFGDWKATRTDWVLVTHPEAERQIALPLKSKSKSALTIGFDDSGALTGLTSDITGAAAERAATITALPATLSAAAKAGGEYAGAISPAAARAAALKQQLDELQTQTQIQGILNPSPDSLKPLREQVTQAELEARLAVAQHLTHDPSALLIVQAPTATS